MGSIRNSIVKKIGLTIFLFIFLLFIIYYNFLNVQIKDYLEQRGMEQLSKESENICSEIEVFLQKYTLIVEQAKDDEEFIKIAKEVKDRHRKREHPLYRKVSKQLENIQSLDQNIAQAYIALPLENQDDLITNHYDYDMDPNYDLTKRDWYLNTIEQDKTTITAPYVDMISKKTAITIAAPLKDNNGIVGAFGLDILMENIQMIMENYNLETEADMDLIYDSGLILYNAKGRGSFQLTNEYIQNIFPPELVEEILSGRSGVVQYSYEGQEKYLAYFPVKDTNIIVVTDILRSKILAPIHKFVLMNLCILILIILLLSLVLLMLRNHFSTPLIKICDEMNHFTQNGSIVLPPKYLDREDEIGVLSNGIVYMLNKISNYILKLEEKNQDLFDAKETINKERLLFKTTIHSLGDGVISTDPFGNILIMNDVAEKLTGWSMQDALGMPFERVFRIIDENTREKCITPIKNVTENKQQNITDENVLLIKKNGEEIAIEDCASPILDDGGNIKGVVVVFRDYTDKKEKQARISYLSSHDQLTGLYNRHFFEYEINRLEQEEIIPLSLALIDVNGLKLINDAFGHQMGDQLLQIVTKALVDVCRKDDTICRIGGDEFVILLPKTDIRETEHVINKIHHKISDQRLKNTIISVSIGCATKTILDQKIMEIYLKAEKNMYRRKLAESQQMKETTIQTIIQTIHEKDPKEKRHSENVGEMSKRIGEALQLNQELLQEIEMAGFLHDIGMIAIDRAILEKQDRLTPSEYEIIKRHSEVGYHILKSVDTFAYLSDYILAHHERWDGTGYPRGLKGKEIPLASRIIMVAGSYEAMTSERVYRSALSKEEAEQELIRCSGTQFDPNIVQVFLNILQSNESK
ncbi:Diguanylate cyclase, GGDEF domain [anaerobic digester metagenome]